jgi:hypothetical protein
MSPISPYILEFFYIYSYILLHILHIEIWLLIIDINDTRFLVV